MHPVVPQIVRLDHVQLAMPPGGEDRAEAFYVGLLGLERVPKPEPLAARGGCWFVRGATAVHLGVEQDFRPARKAHPALVVRDLPSLEAALEAAGVEVRPNPDTEPGRGSYIDDPFGNRIELIAE
jgi:catechol 2,3-dioxygenase-like lactoylglutathione lyase family enzyme